MKLPFHMNQAGLQKSVLMYVLFLSSIVYADEQNHSGHRHHDAHEHGKASLNILLDASTVDFELRTPALNVLGFEHPPNTDEQYNIVREARRVLSQYTTVLTFPGANCKQVDSYLEMPFDDKDAHSQHSHDHHDNHEHESHSEYYLSFSVSCGTADKLSQIEVQLFQQFPGFENIDVQWAGNSSSSMVTVTSEQPVINIK